METWKQKIIDEVFDDFDPCIELWKKGCACKQNAAYWAFMAGWRTGKLMERSKKKFDISLLQKIGVRIIRHLGLPHCDIVE